ncbi:TonB-dependent receptor [Asticcacaulis sp. 201]|uniref:TonB-dependent receptor n=1 Tax=Asticcacaulis sp. 201 TaxID=3028787 RepID=UPI002915E85B|nr:TonB-dependent receptor [Asticcacaulis sp. 201]MDV6330698.1 TonB-dependent receptor [Asticcacaulis sp. 201]
MCLLFAAAILPAQTVHAEAIQPFSVPARPLAAALSQLADQAGIQIIFVGAEVRGRNSHPVSGAMAVQAALQRAAGKDFEVVQAGDTYVIRRRVKTFSRQSSAQPSAIQSDEAPQEVIVTARVSALSRTPLESSYAVTRLTANTIQMSGALSAADLLKAVPGLWVESSGGEASNNIRARGIPRDGFSSLAVQEDGLPVQHDPGLGYLNADQSFRIDDTLQAVEVVRGGPASVFASNALGGLINLIPREAPMRPEMRLRLQAGDGNYRRVDLWTGGPLGEWRVATGGFYRADNGLRPTGYTADQGGQWRLRAQRQWDHVKLSLDYKHLDDRVAFYLPVPLQVTADGEIKPVPGFDALYGTLAGPDTAAAKMLDAKGQPYPFDLSRGTQVLLDQYTVKLRYELSNSLTLNESLRWRRSSTWRNGLFPGYPNTASEKLKTYLPAAQAIYPQATQLGLSYADGTGFAGDGLAIDATLSSVRIPLSELISDTKLEGQAGGHHFTAGLYVAQMNMSMQRLTATTLLEVRNQARRLDIVAYDAVGNALGAMTQDGFTRYGAQFDNYSGTERSIAIYGTDEWTFGKWRADIGIRLEQLKLAANVEQSQAFQGPDTLHIGDDTVLGGTGQFSLLSREFDGQTLSLGLTRPIDDRTQIYGRLTRTRYLPNLTDLTSPPAGDIHTEPVTLSEFGFKHATPGSYLQIVAFSTAFSAYRVTDNVFDAKTNAYSQRAAYGDTLTVGLEVEALWRAHRDRNGPDLALSATWQKPRFETLRYTELVNGAAMVRDFSGNRLLRVPEIMVRLTPGYGFAKGRGRIETPIEYYGDRFADAANTARLPAYATLGVALRYDLTPRLTFILTGDNLGQTLGLTEGNPRAGQIVSGDTGETYFAARPIFGRSFRAALSFRL